MKTAVIFGTRPEIIKLAPVIRELRKQGKDILICNTGQQKELTEQALGWFNIKADCSLDLMSVNQTLTGIVSWILAGVSDILEQQSDCAGGHLNRFWRRVK